MMHRSLENLDPEAASRGQVLHIQNIPRDATNDEIVNKIENWGIRPKAVFWPSLDTVEPGNKWCCVQFKNEQDADRARRVLYGVSMAGSALQASIFRDTTASLVETEASAAPGNPSNTATQESAVVIPWLAHHRSEGIGYCWSGWDKAIKLQREGKTLTLDMIGDARPATVEDEIVMVHTDSGEEITIKYTDTFKDTDPTVPPKTVRQFLEEYNQKQQMRRLVLEVGLYNSLY